MCVVKCPYCHKCSRDTESTGQLQAEKLAASNYELLGHILILIQEALQNVARTWRSWQPVILTSSLKYFLHVLYLFQIVAHLEDLAASNPDLKTKVIGQAKSSYTCNCFQDCSPSGGTGSL